MIFLLTPPLVIIMEFRGVTLPFNICAATREYSRSVMQRVNVTFLLYVIVSLIALFSPDLPRQIGGILIIVLCMVMLTPQILLSYETWNWCKIVSLQAQFRKCGGGSYERGELAILIQNFLKRELITAEMHGYHKWEKFDHIFHLFRTLEYWKRSKKELFRLCGINDFGSDD